MRNICTFIKKKLARVLKKYKLIKIISRLHNQKNNYMSVNRYNYHFIESTKLFYYNYQEFQHIFFAM